MQGPEEHQVDIAIVGGGMVGATLALVLAKHLPQSTLALIDRSGTEVLAPCSELASFDGRSTALSPTSANILADIRVWASLKPKVATIDQIQVSDAGHLGWTRLNRSHNRGRPMGYVVDNHHFGAALYGQMGDCERIQQFSGTEVASVKPLNNGVCLGFASGSVLRADLLVIADGAQSRLGGRLGIAQNIKSYQQTAVVANVRFDKPHSGVAYERFFAQGPLAILPLAGESQQTAAIVWTWPTSDVERILNMPDAEFIEQLHQAFGYRLGNFVTVSKRSSYPLALTLAQEQVRSNIVLMGNSAHFLHPVAGQGFNLSARDAWSLGRVLANSSQPLGSLTTLLAYQSAREQDQFNTVRLSDGFTRFFSSPSRSALATRTGVMFGIEHCSILRSVFIEQMSGRAAFAG